MTQKRDREDLLTDATALVERLSIPRPGRAAPIVAGFRQGGALSIYFEEGDAYHFNSQGELRRAYVGEHMLKVGRGQLLLLDRRTTGGRIAIESRHVSPTDTAQIMADLESRLSELARLLETSPPPVVAEIPPGCAALERLRTWLAARKRPIPIAEQPNVG